MTGSALDKSHTVTHNLPAQPTPFIGREREIEAACALLRRDDVRLVTLTGPGGTGKTRMGIQLATKLLHDFKDGVFFVSLASINDPTLVATSIAQTLGVIEAGNKPLFDSLKSYLQDKKILLALDNFEQVLSAAVVVAELMAAAPELRILATSRARLRVRGEYEFPVPPLTLPDTGRLPSLEALARYEAVRLFTERAVALRPDFAVNDENASAVAEICARLDGLPLAIELAAARIKILSPQAMLTRLVGAGSWASPNSGRMPLLTGGGKDLPARQQTLRSAIEWSYDLLDAEEKTLFRRLSVFSGGRSLEAIEAVCELGSRVRDEGVGAHGRAPLPIPSPYSLTLPSLEIDILDGISSLVDKNLLRRGASEEDEARFVMLETIQEYAREKLVESGEVEALQQRHAEYFLALAEQAEPELHGPKQVEWVRRLEMEHDNFRAALKWSLNDVGAGPRARPERTETALLLGATLMQFWRMHGHLSEGQTWLESALAESTGTPTSAQAKALMALGTLASTQGDFVRAKSALEESLQVFRRLGDKQGIATSLRHMGHEARFQGDYYNARAFLEEGLAIARELGDKWDIANFLGDLGIVTQALGDSKASQALYEETLSIRRSLRDKRGIAMMLVNLGELARAVGNYDAAHSLYKESLALAQELGDKWGVGMILHNLGHVSYHWGKYERALDLFIESLQIFYELRNKRDIAYCLTALAGVFGSQRKPERAAVLFSAAKALSNTVSAHLDPADQQDYERNLAIAQAQMSQPDWERAWGKGQIMSLDDAVTYALDSGQASVEIETRPKPKTTGLLHEPPVAPRSVQTTAPLGQPGEYTGGLSEREVEVLRLVAAGLTDPQVAEQLFISPRTVHRHLSSIYSKLGVTTRTAAARLAIERGLT